MVIGKRKRKNGKKAKKEKEPVIAKPNQQINRFFNNSALKASVKPKPKPAPVSALILLWFLVKTFIQINEEEAEDFMASLLSDFGSNKSKPAERKPTAAMNKPKPTFAKSRLATQHKDESVYTAQETRQAEHQPENGINDDDMGGMDDMSGMDDMGGMDDFGDDYFMDDDNMVENQLKKEVEDLSIGEPAKPNFTTTKAADSRPDLQNWQTAEAGMLDTFAQDVIKEESSNMDILEENGSLHMWWYDAYERKEKGYVYLFGKVLNKTTDKYVSCCVTVKNIERNLFVLPRPYELDGKTPASLLKIQVYSIILE